MKMSLPPPPNVKNKKDGKVAKLQVMPGYLHIGANPLVIDAIENIACLLAGSAPDPETRHGPLASAACELPLLSHETTEGIDYAV